eukprot:m.141202 g.141202  ORF g.141202 m.141202 type:complete len:219 (+) comp14841_c1_seq8:168-824(+)
MMEFIILLGLVQASNITSNGTTSASTTSTNNNNDTFMPCNEMYIAHICCASPKIDTKTQQPENCEPHGSVLVPCFALNGVNCDGKVHRSFSEDNDKGRVPCRGRYYEASSAVFNKTIKCHYTGKNPRSFLVAVSLSVFFGFFGLDRFYLGYPALGLVKLCTGGMFLTWWLLDIVLIASQVLGPSNGDAYYTDYYFPRVENTFAYVSEDPHIYEQYDKC